MNNAGVLYCPPLDALRHGDLGHTAEQADEILTVNLRAPVALIEALAPQMIDRGEAGVGIGGVGGRVVNVASVSAFTGHPDLWYGASKAAICNITKSFAAVLAPSNVLVNAVAPGPTATSMFEQLPASRKENTIKNSYAGRAGHPSEVADTIVWLGTESPAYINGTTLDINNGFHPR